MVVKSMPTFQVVRRYDVIKDIGSGLIAGCIDSLPDPFTFEGLEEAFGDSIVMAVAAANHAARHVVRFDGLLPVLA